MQNNNINRLNIFQLYSNKQKPSKDNSVRRLASAASILSTRNQQALAVLIKFVSIATRMEHSINTCNKFEISINRVKTALKKIGIEESIEEMAKHVIYLASIESPKSAGFKEFFLRHHTISQHAKDFITKNLGIQLKDMIVKSADIDSLLRGNWIVKKELKEVSDYFNKEITLFDEDATRKSVKTLIENCTLINEYGYMVDASKAVILLEQYKNLFDEDTLKGSVKTLIENYSRVDNNGYMFNVSKAKKLLTQYQDLIDKDILKELVNTLIENYNHMYNNGYIFDKDNVIELLTQYKDLIDEDILKELVKTLIENYSRVDNNGYMFNVSKAKKLLTQYQDLIDKDILKELVNTLIENYNRIINNGSIFDEGNVIELLTQYKDLIDEDILKELVKTLIENYSRVDNNGNMFATSIAMKLLTQYQDLFDKNILKELVKTLIENYSRIYNNEYRVYRSFASEVMELLAQHKNLFDEDILKGLVKTLIEIFSSINNNGNMSDARKAMELLTQYKGLLLIKESEFYQRKIIILFNDEIPYILNQLLTNHGDSIAPNILVNKYRTTNSIDIIVLIRRYVQGIGAHRRINLPPRNDMLVNDRPLEGIAFEIHNYTNGIENTVLQTIENILVDFKQTHINYFSIEDLRKKFDLLGSEKNDAKNALDKILESPDSDYASKLKQELPFIAMFLNYNDLLWENNNNNADERWKLWLLQSFVEAGSAYSGGTNGTSCVKGIYERLFTGFRSMHPVIDILYLTKNIIEGYMLNIENQLKELMLAIVEEKKIKSDNGDFNKILKATLTERFKKLLEDQITNEQKKLYDKFWNLHNTRNFILEYIFHNNIPLIEEAMKKFGPYIDYFNDIA